MPIMLLNLGTGGLKMAGIDGKITFETSEYRPCLVNGRKALFHKWETGKDLALIEYANGTVAEVEATSIRFVDRKIDEYCFSMEGFDEK